MNTIKDHIISVTSSQFNREPVGCGGIGDSHHGCAADQYTTPVMPSCQNGPKSLMNVCNTSLNLSREELRQFLKQKEFPFSRKVCLIKKRWVWSMKITLSSSQPCLFKLFKLFKEDLEYDLPEGELNDLKPSVNTTKCSVLQKNLLLLWPTPGQSCLYSLTKKWIIWPNLNHHMYNLFYSLDLNDEDFDFYISELVTRQKINK